MSTEHELTRAEVASRLLSTVGEAESWDGVMTSVALLKAAAGYLEAGTAGGDAVVYTVDDSELARKIMVFLGRATSGSMEPGADPLRDRLAERLALWRPAAQPVPEAAAQADDGARMHDVVTDLREYAGNPGYSHNDYADTMRWAANTIESLRAGFFNYAGILSDKPSAAPTAQPTLPDDERAAFRAHFISEGWGEHAFERYDIHDPDDERRYKSRHVSDMWDGWSARAALRQPGRHSTAAIADSLIADTARHLGVPADVEPTDQELIDNYVEHFGGTAEQAIERLARFAAQYEKEKV